MRLDKFLKVSRLIKRRTVANDLSTGGGVKLNGKIAKPAADVKVGDELTLDLGRHVVTVRIEDVPARAVPAQSAASLYTVLSDVYNNPTPKDRTEQQGEP